MTSRNKKRLCYIAAFFVIFGAMAFAGETARENTTLTLREITAFETVAPAETPPALSAAQSATAPKKSDKAKTKSAQKTIVTVNDTTPAYWARTGDKVHINSACRALKKGYTSGTVATAREAGHTVWCKVCSGNVVTANANTHEN